MLSAGPSASQVGTGSSVVTVPAAKNKAVKHISDHSEQKLLVVKGYVHQVATGQEQHQHQKFPKIPEEILFLWNQPGWHDLPLGKVYVVKGKFHQKRNYVTPGPRLSHFGLRTTWQLDDTTQEWECRELQKKWKLLQDPHAPFQGKGIRAIMLFQQSCTQEAKVAQIGSEGHLLVDTGACASVCCPGSFEGPVNSEAKEELFSVDDSPLRVCGEIRPHLLLGDNESQKAQVTFQVVDGIKKNILSVNRAVDAGAEVHFAHDQCCIQWPDGTKATFYRQGRQFLLPFKELQKNVKKAHIAAIDPTDEEAVAVEEWAEANAHLEDEVMEAQERKPDEDPGLLGDLEDEAQVSQEPQAEGLNQPMSPTWEEKQAHCLTHTCHTNHGVRYVWQQKQKRTSTPVTTKRKKKEQG